MLTENKNKNNTIKFMEKKCYRKKKIYCIKQKGKDEETFLGGMHRYVQTGMKAVGASADVGLRSSGRVDCWSWISGSSNKLKVHLLVDSCGWNLDIINKKILLMCCVQKVLKKKATKLLLCTQKKHEETTK